VKKNIKTKEQLTDEIGQLKSKIVKLEKSENEHKNTVEELKQSESQYRLLAENAIDFIFYMDLKLKFIYLSPYVYESMGYYPEELIGTRLFKYASRREFIKMARVALREIKNYKNHTQVLFETKLIHKKGNEVPVEISGRVILDRKGKPMGVQGNVRDITKRRQAENEKKENQLKIKTLTETAIQFIEFPSDGNIYQFIGEQLKKLVGEDSYIIISSIDNDTNTLSIRAVLDLGKFADKIIKILGKKPTEITLNAKDQNLNYLSDGLLHNARKSLYQISLNSITKPVSHSIEKLFKIGKIYTIGFTNKEQLFGTAIIVLKKGAADIKSPEIIETFIKQACIAIIKMQAEEKLKNRNKELELFNKVTVGRELKMIELKKEINELLNKHGENAKYKIIN